jgi:hypothetical protein
MIGDPASGNPADDCRRVGGTVDSIGTPETAASPSSSADSLTLAW